LSKLVEEIAYDDRAAGDIGLLAGTGFVSDAIREAERVGGELTDPSFEPSHAFICSLDYTFEAIFPRVSLSPWSIYDGQSTRIFRLLASDPLKMAALMRTEHQWLGKSYDLGGVVFGMGIAELEQAFGTTPRKDDVANAHRVWCSELDCDYVGRLLPGVPTPDLTSPARLLGYLMALC
jgi:hypothetical protein